MANEAEREVWNSANGQRWVAFQHAFDRAFGELTSMLFERSGLHTGERVLDVGCGSGTTTLEASKRAGPSGSALGVDISEPLLALAQERARAADARTVQFLLADAQTHVLPANSFDLVCSRLGVMFFDAPVTAFRNLRSALKPGGRLCFVCWASLNANPWLALPLSAGVRRLGPPEAKPPRSPGPMAFSDPDYVREVLTGAGFSGIVVEEVRPFIRGHRTAEEEAAFARAAGPVNRLLIEKNAEPAVRDEIAREIAEGFRPFVTEEGFRAPSTFWRVSASKD